MEEKDKKGIWEKLKNRYIKAVLFFGFYIIFFMIVFTLPTSDNHNKKEEENNNDIQIKDKWELITNNFEYQYNIDIKDKNNPVLIVLEGKKYNHKDYYEKKIDDQTNSIVYTFYDKQYSKINEKWVLQTEPLVIYQGLDESLIDIDSLKSKITSLVATKVTTNFDETVDETYNFNENNTTTVTVTSKDNMVMKIFIQTITKATPIDITLQYKNINKVEDYIINVEDN